VPYSNIKDFEIIIDPLIFDIRLTSENKEIDAELFDTQIISILNQHEGDVYYSTRFMRMFGFQNLIREQSIQCARDVQKVIKTLYSSQFDIALGFSTLGLKEHEHIHKNPQAYKNTPEFNKIMSGYIRFLDIDECTDWVGGGIE